MTAQRLDGTALAQTRRVQLAERVALLCQRGVVPRLGVIVPTRDDAALSYFRAKVRAAEKLGIEVESRVLAEPTTDDIVCCIKIWTQDEAISGIMVETPLPEGIDIQAIREALPASKDVDGAGIQSLGRLLSGKTAFPPATAAAALLLAETAASVAGKHAVVIGRSLVVGRPLALLLLAKDATVTVCHSKTKDLAAIARLADVLFVAVGKADFVNAEMVKPGAVVIDVGTNMVGGKLVGDVDVASIESVASALSPVPGGVGPLTTTLLLEHVVQAAEGSIG